MSANQYQGLIFTNHLLNRMRERGITYQQAWETYKFPDSQEESKNGATERSKKFNDHTITIIYKKNEKNEPVLLSGWIDPPVPGTKDAKEKEWWNKYRKAGFWGKLWLQALKQISL